MHGMSEGLKQTARNLCIHLADPGREAASFYGCGGVGTVGLEEDSETALSPRLRPRAEYATWRRRAKAIARERKVIFYRRSWKTIPVVVMLKARKRARKFA